MCPLGLGSTTVKFDCLCLSVVQREVSLMKEEDYSYFGYKERCLDCLGLCWFSKVVVVGLL